MSGQERQFPQSIAITARVTINELENFLTESQFILIPMDCATDIQMFFDAMYFGVNPNAAPRRVSATGRCKFGQAPASRFRGSASSQFRSIMIIAAGRMKMRRVVVAVVLMSSASGGVYSQGPHFEVASIKTVQPTMGGQSVRGDPGRIDYKQVSLKELILRAFAVPWYRVVWPDWLKDPARGQLPYYDVAATLPAGTPKAQVPLMLQTLLAERLKLTVHREKRDLPVYAMLISKGGIRMHPAKRDADADPDAEPHNVYSVGLGSPEGHITGELPVPAIANSLRNELDRPMVDMTGLEGNFDIDLHWAHEAEPLPGRGAPLAETASMPTGGNTASLFAALEKQLGIHVEARKIPAEMLIIDRVERVPTEN